MPQKKWITFLSVLPTSINEVCDDSLIAVDVAKNLKFPTMNSDVTFVSTSNYKIGYSYCRSVNIINNEIDILYNGAGATRKNYAPISPWWRIRNEEWRCRNLEQEQDSYFISMYLSCYISVSEICVEEFDLALLHSTPSCFMWLGSVLIHCSLRMTLSLDCMVLSWRLLPVAILTNTQQGCDIIVSQCIKEYNN